MALVCTFQCLFSFNCELSNPYYCVIFDYHLFISVSTQGLIEQISLVNFTCLISNDSNMFRHVEWIRLGIRSSYFIV